MKLRNTLYKTITVILIRGFKYEVQHGLEIHGTPVSAS